MDQVRRLKRWRAICAGCLTTTPCSSNMIGPFQSAHKISAEITPATSETSPTKPECVPIEQKFKKTFKYQIKVDTNTDVMKERKNGHEENNVRHIEAFDSKREKVKSDVLRIENVLNNSFECESRCSSPILSANRLTGTAGTPGTPVDIKSVPKVRQLSCKKLIYSYTFGSNCSDCSSSNSSCDASPNLFAKSQSKTTAVINRSPTSNCRQNYSKSSGQFIASNIEIASTQKRKN